MRDDMESVTTLPREWSSRLRTVETNLKSHEEVCADRYKRLGEDLAQFRLEISTSRGEMKDIIRDVRADTRTTNQWLIRLGMALLAGMGGILFKLALGQ